MASSKSNTIKPPWPGWLKTLIVLLVLAMMGFGTVAMMSHLATRKWEQYADSLRARGEPITLEELQARRPIIPDEQNSARVIERFAAELDQRGRIQVPDNVLVLGQRSMLRVGDDEIEVGGKSALDVDFFRGIPRHTVEPSRQYFETQEELLEILAALRDMPQGRFDIQVAPNPIHTLLPHLTGVRQAGKLVSLQHTVQLISGDSESAYDNLELSFNIAASLAEEPFTISQLVHSACQRLALQQTENHLLLADMSDAQLRKLASTIAARCNQSRFLDGLRGERAVLVGVCEALIRGDMKPSDWFQNQGSANPLDAARYFTPTFIIRKNQTYMAKAFSRLIDEGNDPIKIIKAARTLEGEARKLPKTLILARFMMPSISRATVLDAKTHARFDCTISGLAAERYRLETGELPATIEVLVPKYLDSVPVDPFDGKPMKLAVTEEGIVIYSIDENLVDDGGDVAQRDNLNHPFDVGFRLFKQEHRGLRLIDEPIPNER